MSRNSGSSTPAQVPHGRRRTVSAARPRPHKAALTAWVRQIGRQRQAAVGAAGRAVIDDGIGIGRQHTCVALVARLRSARAGLLAPLLAVRRGRLGRGARRLRRPLKLQHQFDQFRLAQPFEILATHARRESGSWPRHKAPNVTARPTALAQTRLNPLGNYWPPASPTPRPARSSTPTRSAGPSSPASATRKTSGSAWGSPCCGSPVPIGATDCCCSMTSRSISSRC